MVPLCRVLRDSSAQNSAAARSDRETASSCSWASVTWCCWFIRCGGRWSRLIWTQTDGPVSHWASDRGASRFLPYRIMFSLLRGCYQGSDQIDQGGVDDETSLLLQVSINNFINLFKGSFSHMKRSDAKASKYLLIFCSKMSIFSGFYMCRFRNFPLIAIHWLFSLPSKWNNWA